MQTPPAKQGVRSTSGRKHTFQFFSFAGATMRGATRGARVRRMNTTEICDDEA
jgi:hypothetical protein